MGHLDIVLPVVLVAIAFLLKLFMDQNATVPLMIRSLYELPVDMVFLAISFSVADAIASPMHQNRGLFNSFVFIVVVLISAVVWRRSIRFFETNRKRLSAVLFLVNMCFAGFGLAYSISALLEAHS